MKKVEALIPALHSAGVIAALRKREVGDIVLSEGLSTGPSQERSYRGARYAFDYAPQLRVELVVHDDLVATTIDTIEAAVRTASVGDVTISVASVERVIEVECEAPQAVTARSATRHYGPVPENWGQAARAR